MGAGRKDIRPPKTAPTNHKCKIITHIMIMPKKPQTSTAAIQPTIGDCPSLGFAGLNVVKLVMAFFNASPVEGEEGRTVGGGNVLCGLDGACGGCCAGV